jgi:hypothetical protein
MTRDRRLALLAALVPGAISLGALALVAAGAGAAPKVAHEEGKVLGESAGDFGHVEALPGCLLENNTFNRKIADAGQQRVYRAERDGQPAFGWEWSWENTHPLVVAYPELICGQKPFMAGAPGAGFPFQQGKRDLTVQYQAVVDASGQHALMFSLWVVSALPPSGGNITHEIQLHVLPMSPIAPGWLVEELPAVTLDGVTWDLWRHPDGAGARENRRVSPGVFTWPVLLLIARKPMPEGPLHVGGLLQHLVDRRLLPAGAWIADLELGSAVVQGQGWVRVTGFALKPSAGVRPARPPPGRPTGATGCRSPGRRPCGSGRARGRARSARTPARRGGGRCPRRPGRRWRSRRWPSSRG